MRVITLVLPEVPELTSNLLWLLRVTGRRGCGRSGIIMLNGHHFDGPDLDGSTIVVCAYSRPRREAFSASLTTASRPRSRPSASSVSTFSASSWPCKMFETAASHSSSIHCVTAPAVCRNPRPAPRRCADNRSWPCWARGRAIAIVANATTSRSPRRSALSRASRISCSATVNSLNVGKTENGDVTCTRPRGRYGKALFTECASLA